MEGRLQACNRGGIRWSADCRQSRGRVGCKPATEGVGGRQIVGSQQFVERKGRLQACNRGGSRRSADRRQSAVIGCWLSSAVGRTWRGRVGCKPATEEGVGWLAYRRSGREGQRGGSAVVSGEGERESAGWLVADPEGREKEEARQSAVGREKEEARQSAVGREREKRGQRQIRVGRGAFV